MRKTFIPLLILLSMGVIIFFSCQKEISCENCKGNKPPIAIAGADQIITLPVDSISLDGTLSNDPDGRISSYLWTKISGPASFIIIKPSDSTTKVKTLVTGTYQFELKVTDNGGLNTKDTMKVIVSDPGQPNRPPVANAGIDQTITLPNNTITLDGTASTDPDNNITSYAWTKISGPASLTISNATSMQTPATNLVEGVYLFELKVTDAGGLLSNDTMQMIVNAVATAPQCNAQLIPFGTLSIPRSGALAASSGNKILFAGGVLGSNVLSSRVDIYDTTTQSWSIAELSQARYGMAVVSAGNKIFFAGGSPDELHFSSRVDIYDASTNTWSIAELSKERANLTAASIGNKVFFAGGNCWLFYTANDFVISTTDVVDIHDISSNTWSTGHLSEARQSLSSATSGNNIYFAGGLSLSFDPVNLSNSFSVSGKIDIYNVLSGTWSTTTLTTARYAMGAISANNKIFWAGGNPVLNNLTNEVEIFEVNSQSSSYHQLSQARAGIQTVIKDNKILFFTGSWGPGNRVDIYDIASQMWCWAEISASLQSSAVGSASNNIYVGGGLIGGNTSNITNQVWKLEF
jgi:hypothetical protein